MSVKIKIYSKDYCSYCDQAKRFFKEKGLAFEEIDVTKDLELMERIKKETGHKTVPLIFINDRFIGGYSDMMEKYRAKALPELDS